MSDLFPHEGPLAVYLLHFEQPVRGKRHYVGITTAERLGARMIEHTTGRGAKLTSSACRLGVGWRLAHVWRTAQPALEATLERLKEQPQTCPVCRRISTGIGYKPTKKGSAAKRPLFGRFTLSEQMSFPNGLAEIVPARTENTP